MNRRYIFLSVGLLITGGLGGFRLKSVLADGIPSPDPLYYSGTLAENGSLVTGTRSLEVNLYADGTSASPLCQTVASNTPVSDGRFRIQLDSACKSQINANPNAWVEVLDGTTSFGRSKIGAVPYAIEADHAVNSTNAQHATSATSADTANAAGGTLASSISTIQNQIHPGSGFRAQRTSAVNVPNATETQVVFDSVIFDTAGEYNSSTGVFAPKAAGTYLLTCGFFYLGGSTLAQFDVTIRNGPNEVEGSVAQNGGGGSSLRPEVTVITQLAAGDSVTCATYQNTGATVTTYGGVPDRNSFSAVRLY